VDVPPDLRITVTDVQLAGYCIGKGAKPWFKAHGLDFRDFLKNGILAADLIAAGDAHAVRVVEAKLQRDIEVPDDLVITAEDVRASMKCDEGAVEWAERHGFDYERGVRARALIATGDREAIRIVRDRLSRG